MYIVDMITKDLRLPRRIIEQLAEQAESRYKLFKHGKRRIEAPDSELKLLQIWIAEFVRSVTPEVPDFVTAYEPKKSIVLNAKMHRDNSHLLNIDIKDFFHSWRTPVIKNFFLQLNYDDECRGKSALSCGDADILTKLVVFRDRLPVGSPASPCIANRLMLEVDTEISSLLPDGYIYTRYSDDITISSSQKINYISLVSEIEDVLTRYSLTLNRRKIQIAGKGDNRRITGVFLTPEGRLSIGKKRRDALKISLYKYFTRDVHSVDLQKRARKAKKILGQINFCKQIEPVFVAKMLYKYSKYQKDKNFSGSLITFLTQEAQNYEE